tara:strand:- start:4228 stop:5925 length:1698 start_codon:yes stop_codon:yes gene_type:complete
MAIRALNRPSINITEPESGLDKFFNQLAKYSDPEYQLRKQESDARMKFRQQENERANARIILSRKDFLQRKSDKINENLRNLKIDSLREDEFELKEKQVENQSFKNSYDISKAEIDESLKMSYGDSSSASQMNVESVLAGIPDVKVRTRLKPYVQSYKDKALRDEQKAEKFMSRFNKARPGSEIDIEDAKTFIEDPSVMKSYLYDSYIKDKPEISQDEKTQIDIKLNELTRNESKRNKFIDSEIYQMGRGTDKAQQAAYDEVASKIQALDGKIEFTELEISQLSSTNKQGVFDLGDSFNKKGGNNIEQPVTENLFGATENLFSANPYVDDEYDIAFGTDDEAEQVIVDTAIDTAQKNATGENTEDVIVDKDIPDNVPDAWTEPATEDMEGNIVSDLNLAVARPQLPPNFIDPSIPEKDLRPRYKEPPEEEGIAGDLPIENIEFDDLSGLAKAQSPTIDNLKSLNIVDDKGEALNLVNPAKFQFQLKSMYNKVFRKGARSRLSKEEYTRLNKQLIKMISTASIIEPDVTNRMTKIIPREIEMFLKSKKRNRDSIVKTLQENIKWAN